MMGAPLDPAIAQARDASRGLGTYAHEGPGYIGKLHDSLERMIGTQMEAYPQSWSDEDRREMARLHLFQRRSGMTTPQQNAA